MPTKDDLKILQALPLEIKIEKTKARIREWVSAYGEDGVYVSFSGGKDSTVLLHIVRSLYPSVEAVFVNTGLEYPEIQKFVKTFENVTILRPKMRFDEVISKYGYPMISKETSKRISEARNGIKNNRYCLALCQLGVKDDEYGGLVRDAKYDYEKTTEGSAYECKKYRPLIDLDFNLSSYCCNLMKKSPAHEWEKQTGKVPIMATMTEESKLREQKWLLNGCNAFEVVRPNSAPMSFWTEQDVLRYIKEYNIPIASVYGDVVKMGADGYYYSDTLFDCGIKYCTTGCERTGCIFCGFGAHREKGEGRFERLKRTHPKQYAYCMNGGAYDADGLWKPTKDGLGMRHVIDELNKIYGENFIKY